jgi:hypothetical protein
MRVSSVTRNQTLCDAYPDRKTKGVQVNFTGNVTALRQHIKRMGGKHYELYRAHCTANGIDVHATAVPDAIKNKPGNSQHEQQLITDYAAVKPETAEWNKEGLLDRIVRFVVETDQVTVHLCVGIV